MSKKRLNCQWVTFIRNALLQTPPLVFLNKAFILRTMDYEDIQQTQADSQFEGLSNHFLIAMPGLNGSSFSQSVAYICEHSINGAIGLVINYPINITLGELFAQMNLKYDTAIGETPLFSGGPVQAERGFILHSTDKSWESTLTLSETISITSSKDILTDIAHNRGPEKFLVTLGYAGWSAGQLEDEIVSNSWLTIPADKQIIFDTPVEQRWTASAQPLGVDMNLIANQAGHA